MAVQKFNGLELGNMPNATPEQIQEISNAGTVVDRSIDGMSPMDQIKYRAQKMAADEEMDPNLMRAMGKDSMTPRATPENLQMAINGQRPAMAQVDTIAPIQQQRSPEPSQQRSAIVPRPPVGKSPFVSSAKDELTVPIYKVTEFIRLVMGDNFGYVSKKTASEMIDIIPKDCAMLAIETSEEYAKKFLQYHDEEVQKAALKRVFHVSTDEELNTYEKIMNMPGFEINPWKE